MIDLIITLCLTDRPTVCKDISATYEQPIAACITPQAQMEVFKLAENHPNWHIKGYRCKPHKAAKNFGGGA